MLSRAIALSALASVALSAQVARAHDPTRLTNWPAPLYWQTSVASAEPAVLAAQAATGSLPIASAVLVFVAMTPCRLVDTRAGQGFPGAFGPPSLVGGAVGRTFPIQSSTTCPIPSIAQAYSLNLTVVAAAPFGFITAYPTPGPLPLAATAVWAQALIVGNAAVVPAGTGGSIDVYANANTDLVIDVNGYYAPPAGLNDNTALGDGVLTNNTTGSYNTAIGSVALNANTTGRANTATGLGALATNTAGSSNTASGYGSLGYNTTGSSNTAVGVLALSANTTGINNIALGTNAASKVSGGNNDNIHIGTMGSASDSSTIRLGGNTAFGDAVQTKFFVAGVRGVTTENNDAIPVVIDSGGQLGTVSSSRRFKEDVRNMGEVSNGLLRLRPVTFRYQKPFADGSKPIQYGLIAEEVAKVYPELVVRSADGQIESVKYQVLDSMLLNELQKQAETNRQQVEELRLLKARLAALEALLPKVEIRRVSEK